MGIKILLADDSVTAQNMGKKILSEAGHEVITVSNGAAAAKKIAEVKPELVVLDVFMPGYSGLELCERLRNSAETSKIPVLLTVGRMEPYSPNDGARVKADGVIVKPFEATDLTAAVERLAEKIKGPEKDDARSMKIVARQESAQKAEPSQSDTAKPSTPDATAYEPTMKLDAAQIAEILKKADEGKTTAPAAESAPKQETSVSTPAYSMEEFQVQEQNNIVEESASAKAGSKSGESSDPAAFEVPSYMSQYIETEEPAPSASIESSFPSLVHGAEAGAERHEFLPSLHAMAEQPPIAAAEGLELTAAAPVADQPVQPAPGFEATLQPSEPLAQVAQDPALVTDAHAANMDFPTQFGIGEPGLTEYLIGSVQSTPEVTVAPIEADFEARLDAALASYEEPALEISGPEPDVNLPVSITDVHSEQSASDMQAAFDAQVAAAMQSFDAPAAPGEVIAESHSSQNEFEASSSTDELTAAAHEPEPDMIPVFSGEESREYPSFESTSVQHDEDPVESALQHADSDFSRFSQAWDEARQAQPAESSSVDAVAHVTVPSSHVQESAASMEGALVPETDEAVIEQMREGLSHLPAERPHISEESEPAPMAMAAAAASAPTVVPPSLMHDAETEVARAVSTAMSHEPTSADDSSATVNFESHEQAGNANHLAGAVEKVMKRELPSLIWKIMAELDLRKRD